MELRGTQCYREGLAHLGRRDPCRRVQQQRSLKPSLAIACSLQRKPTPLSFVRDCSAWPAIGCGRPWKRTTWRHQPIALCGAVGLSPHAAWLERAREPVFYGVDFFDARSTAAACAHSYANSRRCSRRLGSSVRSAARAQSLAWCSYNLGSAGIDSLLMKSAAWSSVSATLIRG